MLKGLKEQGITILVSTPYMDEASLCEKIALIQEGKILSVDKPEHVIKAFPDDLFAIEGQDMGRLLKTLRDNPLVKSANSFGAYHHITFKEKQVPFETWQKTLPMETTIKPISPSIEDCFIKLMST